MTGFVCLIIYSLLLVETVCSQDQERSLLIAVLAIMLALGFDFVNGFHDTANACATVIYTKALKPGAAILWAGILNFLGATLVGTAVAQVITKIIPADNGHFINYSCCFISLS